MAVSQTEIVNLALTKLEQDRLVSIDDDVEAARVMRSMWDMARDSVLAMHPWKFAITRTSLPALADAPAYGWARQFQIPEACLRLVQVADDWTFYTQDTETFQLEAGRILTDEAAPLRVRYVQRMTNPGLYPVLFARALAMFLANDASGKLTGSVQKGEKAMLEFDFAIKAARQQNAIERPPQQLPGGSWLAARGV